MRICMLGLLHIIKEYRRWLGPPTAPAPPPHRRRPRRRRATPRRRALVQDTNMLEHACFFTDYFEVDESKSVVHVLCSHICNYMFYYTKTCSIN